jgi:hypothetical protein
MHQHPPTTSRPPRMWGLTIALCLIPVAMLGLPAVSSAESCPNAVFRNGPSSLLPDCRAYEMVTPPYKEGFPVTMTGYPAFRVEEDGSSVVGESFGDFAGTENDAIEGEHIAQSFGSDYLITRGVLGWSPTAISPSAAQYPEGGLLALSSGLTGSLWAEATTAQSEAAVVDGAETPAESFFVRSINGPMVEVGPILPPGVSPKEVSGKYAEFIAASPSDLSTVLFSMSERHWPGDETEPGAESLYEYVGTGNSAPLLVGVSGGKLISRCGTQLAFRPASAEYGSRRSYQGAVSSSGSTVFFIADACEGEPPVAELFAHVDNGQPGAETVAISEPSQEDCPGCDIEAGALAGATFQGASADGSEVFFTTSQPLLGGDASNNLYEYDLGAPVGSGSSSGRVVRVSGGDTTVASPVAGVERVLYVSPDGSHVYFAASGVLTRTPNGIGQEAKDGQSNLYLYERDSEYPAGRTVFVMPYADAIENAFVVGSGPVEGGFEFAQNGSFIAFESYAHLTPDDLSSLAQGFEYDSLTGGFARYSIGQDGFNADGNTGSSALGEVANDGSVYFNSVNPLVPRAVSGMSNVYEYREGSVNLISSGQDTYGTGLEFISPSGKDVFFHTFDRLVPRDTDDQEDTYDARAGGGFSEPSSPPQCQADACQGPLSGAPVLLSPGSEFQAGGENAQSSALQAGEAKSKAKAQGRPKHKHARKKRKTKKTGRAKHSTDRNGGRQ